jgi:hypothetical protein
MLRYFSCVFPAKTAFGAKMTPMFLTPRGAARRNSSGKTMFFTLKKAQHQNLRFGLVSPAGLAQKNCWPT